MPQLRIPRSQRISVLVALLATVLAVNATILGADPTAPVWGLWVSFASALAILPVTMLLPRLFEGLNVLVSVTHRSHPDYLAYKEQLRTRART